MTSNHEGVSCDSCRKSNFRGLRYKCLICFDYDLCSTCYESGLTSSRHTNCHPMQCIVARNDYDLFYAGESASSEQPLSFTCPLCGSLGFSESTLLEHVTNEHANSDNGESSAGVVCPVCGVETNQLTYDFATHLTMEHRAPRDPVEQVAVRGRGGRSHARCMSGLRGRRTQSHYNSVGGPTGSSPSAREASTDPLVEILAQLSGVRRTAGASNQSSASQLHQLQQLHLQSSPPFAPRTNNDREVRLMRRTFQTMNNQLNSSSTSTSTAVPNSGLGQSNSNASYCNAQPFILMDQNSLGPNIVGSGNPPGPVGPSSTAQPGALPGQADASPLQYLLPKCLKPTMTEAELQQREILRADRSLFVQELLFQIGLLEEKPNK